MNKAKEIMVYGERIDEIELDINIHQKLYRYEKKLYLITMKNGEIISIFQVV